MTIKKSEDKELVKEIQTAIKANGGYCCCAIEKTQDTKCMCKDFMSMVENGYEGPCHCGLYTSAN